MLYSLIIISILSMGPYGSGMNSRVRALWIERGINAAIQDVSIQKELNLTKEQIKQLQDIKFSTDKKVIKMRNDLELKEVDLREELSKDTPDMNRIKRIVSAKHSIMADIELAKLEEYMRIKKIMTLEQIEKLREIMRERARQRVHRNFNNKKRERRSK